MTNSGDAAETVVRHRNPPAADGLGSEKSAGAVRGAGKTAQTDLRQNPNEEDPKGHPRHPGIPHDQGAVPRIPEKSQALPAALCVHPGQGRRRTN